MSVITVDTLSRRPIYEQLIDNVKKSVLCGTLAPGEQMPSVRALAVELAVTRYRRRTLSLSVSG